MTAPPPTRLSREQRRCLDMEPQIPGLQRYLRLLGARPDEVEDLIQDCAVVYLRGTEEIEEPRRLRAWLRGTGRRLLIGRRRNERRRWEAWAESVDRWLECHVDVLEGGDSPWSEALEACLAELGGRATEVLHRVYTQGEDRAVVAADLGLRQLGLKTLLQRSRELLRRCVLRRLS